MKGEKGFFKGRVVETGGSKIIIDVRAKDIFNKEGTRVGAEWNPPKPMPKVGDIVRGRFRVRE